MITFYIKILRKINFWNTLLYDYRCSLEKVNIVKKKIQLSEKSFHFHVSLSIF